MGISEELVKAGLSTSEAEEVTEVVNDKIAQHPEAELEDVEFNPPDNCTPAFPEDDPNEIDQIDINDIPLEILPRLAKRIQNLVGFEGWARTVINPYRCNILDKLLAQAESSGRPPVRSVERSGMEYAYESTWEWERSIGMTGKPFPGTHMGAHRIDVKGKVMRSPEAKSGHVAIVLDRSGSQHSAASGRYNWAEGCIIGCLQILMALVLDAERRSDLISLVATPDPTELLLNKSKEYNMIKGMVYKLQAKSNQEDLSQSLRIVHKRIISSDTKKPTVIVIGDFGSETRFESDMTGEAAKELYASTDVLAFHFCESAGTLAKFKKSAVKAEEMGLLYIGATKIEELYQMAVEAAFRTRQKKEEN